VLEIGIGTKPAWRGLLMALSSRHKIIALWNRVPEQSGSHAFTIVYDYKLSIDFSFRLEIFAI